MLRKNNKRRRLIQLVIGAAAVAVVLSPMAMAQVQAPSAILNQYRSQRTTWFGAVFPFANTLFGLLATIEFAWSAAAMLLEKSDMQSWTSALIRKLMWIGAFYALLIYGRFWIPATTDSFELIGQTAAGTGPMSPSDVFTRGIDIAGALMATSSTAAFFTNLGTSLAMIVTGMSGRCNGCKDHDPVSADRHRNESVGGLPGPRARQATLLVGSTPRYE